MYKIVFEQISLGEGGNDNKMDEYTSNFFKIVIRIFQTSRKVLNLQYVQKSIDKLITGEKLLVVVNSLPLYLAIQMFFEPKQIDQSETGSTSIIFKVQQVITNELRNLKNNKNIANPMLTYYRLNNLIKVSTSMLQYFLCF